MKAFRYIPRIASCAGVANSQKLLVFGQALGSVNTDPFWAEWGSDILVECKNWSSGRPLKEIVDVVVMPRKGRLSAVDRARQSDPEFVRLRQQHSAVESAINALESHGLDLCRDHGIVGFKRYVAIAVLARNIQRLGAILRQQEADRIRGPYKQAA